jgi:HAD superfamily hydrolase (TIGR01509 family)
MSEKLVIFDCDGVLVDSEFLANKVFVEMMSRYGYSISLEDSIRKFTGINEHTCREMILQESGIDLPIDYWSSQLPVLQEAYKTALMPLLQPVLETLSLNKISRCVASNSARSHVVHCLEHTRQLNFFNEGSIFSAQQVSKPKPAPDLFLLAAKEMNVSPKNCIVIEDSLAGAQAAIAAGMQVLMFLGGSHAQYSFYRERVEVLGKPVFMNCDELSEAIQGFM